MYSITVSAGGVYVHRINCTSCLSRGIGGWRREVRVACALASLTHAHKTRPGPRVSVKLNVNAWSRPSRFVHSLTHVYKNTHAHPQHPHTHTLGVTLASLPHTCTQVEERNRALEEARRLQEAVAKGRLETETRAAAERLAGEERVKVTERVSVGGCIRASGACGKGTFITRMCVGRSRHVFWRCCVRGFCQLQPFSLI